MLPLITAVLAICSFLSLYRLLFGPTLFDRLIGANLIATMVTCIMVVLAVHFNRRIYLDVALVYAILGYVGIIAVTRYTTGKPLK